MQIVVPRARWQTLFAGAAIILTAARPLPAAAQDADRDAAGDTGSPEQAALRTVEVTEYFVEGNTILGDEDIERAVYPFMGPGQTLQDIEKARAALQQAYESRGYKTVFVELPQQNVVGGRIRLAVVETRIGEVRIAGAGPGAERRIAEALPSIGKGTVPDLDTFGSELAAFNGRSADRQVTPELTAGAAPGTIDVALAVEDKLPLHGSIELNNQYSRDTTALRSQATLRYDDLWGAGHSIAAFVALAPRRPSDSTVYLVSYGAPLTPTLRLDVQGLVSNSDVATIGSTNVLGDGKSVTATLSKTLGGPADLYHRVSLAIAWKDFDETVRFGGDAARTPIRYFPVSLGYAGSLRMDGGTELGFNAAATFAFRGLGTDTEGFGLKRYRASGGFAYLRGGATVLQPLPAGAEAFLSLEGQLASEPLVSNEQFSIGGAGSVRGYLQSEGLGDNALFGSFELRSPTLAGIAPGLFDEIRLYGFIDGARVWIKSTLPDQLGSTQLYGAGGGLRARLFDHLSGEVELGFPLRGASTTREGEPRLHFKVSADF